MKRIYFYFTGMVIGTVASVYSTLQFIFGIYNSDPTNYLWIQAEHSVFFGLFSIICTLAAREYFKKFK